MTHGIGRTDSAKTDRKGKILEGNFELADVHDKLVSAYKRFFQKI